MSSALSVGEKVKARWKGGSFYWGRVSAANADGTFAIQFDDGDFEPKEPLEHIQRIAPPSTDAATFKVGDAVRASYKGSSTFYPGCISADNGATFAVQFDDGDFDGAVPRTDVRHLDSGGEQEESRIEISRLGSTVATIANRNSFYNRSNSQIGTVSIGFFLEIYNI